MANDTRQNMIERTAALLSKKGLQGTSFTEVLEASGAPRGSLYHHFPGGKDELVMAAMEFAGARVIQALEGAKGLPADAVARQFFGAWRTILERSAFRSGCAVAAVTIATTSSELIDGAGAVFRTWRQRLGDLLAAGGVPEARATALAAAAIAICEGAVILCRAEQSLEPFDLVVEEEIHRITLAMTRSGSPTAPDQRPHD
jgi:TetR/AcrR family transcriptional regulator, lmrAB and yxaGH operons repressor